MGTPKERAWSLLSCICPEGWSDSDAEVVTNAIADAIDAGRPMGNRHTSSAQSAHDVVEAYAADVLTGQAPGISLADMIESAIDDAVLAERDRCEGIAVTMQVQWAGRECSGGDCDRKHDGDWANAAEALADFISGRRRT